MKRIQAVEWLGSWCHICPHPRLQLALPTIPHPFEVPLPLFRNQGYFHMAQYVYSMQDRKSTRLNSSHVRISYAVFCLKKKKINTINTTRLTSNNRHTINI